MGNLVNLVVKWNVGTKNQEEAQFVLMHFPIASWENLGRGVIHLHGHVHLPNHRRVGAGKVSNKGYQPNPVITECTDEDGVVFFMLHSEANTNVVDTL